MRKPTFRVVRERLPLYRTRKSDEKLGNQILIKRGPLKSWITAAYPARPIWGSFSQYPRSAAAAAGAQPPPGPVLMGVKLAGAILQGQSDNSPD